MKRFSEQLNKKSQTVKLRAAEKRDLRERVVSYMEYHPLPADLKAKIATKSPKILTEEYQAVAVPFRLLGKWAFAAAAIVLVFLPVVAERSVPGDGLYAVKRFNEEVRGTLVFDTVQKVEWETERLNRRIAEARLLASEGRLTDEVETEVAAAVRTHSDNAQKSIEVLRGEDADEATLASIALETTLTVQSAALHDKGDVGSVVSADDAVATMPSILATAVEETRMRANVNNASSTIPAFDKVMAKVEINTTRVYELRDSLIDVASSEQVAEVTRRIQDIERAVAAAIALRESDDETARAELIGALQHTQKLIVFMTDIEVSQNVDIESIVPIVLTPAEKQTILSDYERELETRLAQIADALVETTEVDLVEKAETIIAEIDLLQQGINTASTFAVSESIAKEALSLADKIYVMLSLGATQPETEEISSEPVVNEAPTSTPATATNSDPVAPDVTVAPTGVPSDADFETSLDFDDQVNSSTRTDSVAGEGGGAVSTGAVDDQ